MDSTIQVLEGLDHCGCDGDGVMNGTRVSHRRRDRRRGLNGLGDGLGGRGTAVAVGVLAAAVIISRMRKG